MNNSFISPEELRAAFRYTLINNIRAIYKTNPVGGELHIVLDDYNVEDLHIKWCITNIQDNPNISQEEKFLYLQTCEMLLQFSEHERFEIIREALND